jgi:prefoldin subunit 5
MNDSIQTARELATHASDIAHLQSDMDAMATDISEIKKTLASINTTLAEAKGGWRVLMMFGGAGGLAGAILTQLFHSIPGGK